MVKTFRTLVKNDVKCNLLDTYEYALGTVNGILLTECDLPYGLEGDQPQVTEFGTVLTTRCAERAYDNFKAIVQWLYPGLCEFDYEST